jgi:hypothetical protein
LVTRGAEFATPSVAVQRSQAERGNEDLAFYRLLHQLDQFLDRGAAQAFALGFEGFGHVDGDILHAFVGFLGAADEKEFLALGDAFMFVFIVETDAEQTDSFGGFCFGFAGHELLRFVNGMEAVYPL